MNDEVTPIDSQLHFLETHSRDIGEECLTKKEGWQHRLGHIDNFGTDFFNDRYDAQTIVGGSDKFNVTDGHFSRYSSVPTFKPKLLSNIPTTIEVDNDLFSQMPPGFKIKVPYNIRKVSGEQPIPKPSPHRMPIPSAESTFSLKRCDEVIKRCPSHGGALNFKGAVLLSRPDGQSSAKDCFLKALAADERCADGMINLVAWAVQSKDYPVKERLSTAISAVNKALHATDSSDIRSAVSGSFPKAFELSTVRFFLALLQHVKNLEQALTEQLEDAIKALDENRKVQDEQLQQSVMKDIKKEQTEVLAACTKMFEELDAKIKVLERQSTEHGIELKKHDEAIGELQAVAELREYRPEEEAAGQYFDSFVLQLSATYTHVMTAYASGGSSGDSGAGHAIGEVVDTLCSLIPIFGSIAGKLAIVLGNLVDNVRGAKKKRKLERMLELQMSFDAFGQLCSLVARNLVDYHSKKLEKLRGVYPKNENEWKMPEGSNMTEKVVNFFAEKSPTESAAALWGKVDAMLLVSHLQAMSVAKNLRESCASGESCWTMERKKKMAEYLTHVIVHHDLGRLNKMVKLRVRKCTALPLSLSFVHLHCAARCGGVDGVTGPALVKKGIVVWQHALVFNIDDQNTAKTIEFTVPGLGSASLNLSTVRKNGERVEIALPLKDATLHVCVVTTAFLRHRRKKR